MSKTIKTGFISNTINGIKVNSGIPCSSDNYNNNVSRVATYVVMHYTGNAKDLAVNNAKYFQGSGRKASAHFFVDDSSIYQSVELRDTAWHCGTSGTYYHTSCRNANSIGIEMCCTSGNYKISDKTKKNAAYLCAYICKLLGINGNTVDTYVLRHYDVTHKSCPAQMAGKSNKEWTEFKAMVKKILKAANSSAGASKTEGGQSNSGKDSVKGGSARSFDKGIAGTYIVNTSTDPLMLRSGAGANKSLIAKMPKGAKVQCYGYYTKVSGVKWYFVDYKGKTGFASSKYLKKK